MKLTRKELVHAQDRQLAAIGIRRSNNSGWLAKASAREFTTEQLELFHNIRRGNKADTPRQSPLVGQQDEADRAERLAVCSRCLIEQIDQIHAALCPGQNGTWKDRTLQAVAAAKAVAAPPMPVHETELFSDGTAESFANELFEKTGRDLA